VFVLAALVIYDNESKRALKAAVSQTICELKEYLRTIGKDARLRGEDIRELKGAKGKDKKHYVPGLNDYPELRNRFLERIVQTANFSVHVLYLDLSRFKQPVATIEHERYGTFLQNLLWNIRVIPTEAKLIAITIDSSGTAQPVQEGEQSYTWRKRRRRERSENQG